MAHLLHGRKFGRTSAKHVSRRRRPLFYVVSCGRIAFHCRWRLTRYHIVRSGCRKATDPRGRAGGHAWHARQQARARQRPRRGERRDGTSRRTGWVWPAAWRPQNKQHTIRALTQIRQALGLGVSSRAKQALFHPNTIVLALALKCPLECSDTPASPFPFATTVPLLLAALALDSRRERCSALLAPITPGNSPPFPSPCLSRRSPQRSRQRRLRRAQKTKASRDAPRSQAR